MKKNAWALGLCLAAAASAQANQVIDFEAIPDLTTVSNQYPGVVFSSPGSSVEVSNYFQTNYGTAAPKIACPRDPDSYCSGVLQVDFLAPALSVSFLFTGDNTNGQVATARYYDATGGLLATHALYGDGQGLTAHLESYAYAGVLIHEANAGAGIARLTVTVTEAERGKQGLGYDDFNVVSTVPEPSATLAMMLGLLVVGAVTRRHPAMAGRTPS